MQNSRVKVKIKNHYLLTQNLHYKNNYKSISFEFEFNNDSFEIKIDKSQISRVLQNLVINAIHSIEEKKNFNGNILIKTSNVNNNGVKFKAALLKLDSFF
mgnify:CR=1 FL=1